MFLGVSFSTVDAHRSRAMKQLEIGRIALLTRYAIESGISPIGDELTTQEERILGRAG